MSASWTTGPIHVASIGLYDVQLSAEDGPCWMWEIVSVDGDPQVDGAHGLVLGDIHQARARVEAIAGLLSNLVEPESDP